jgi:hypothetical protein
LKFKNKNSRIKFKSVIFSIFKFLGYLLKKKQGKKKMGGKKKGNN